MRSWDGRLTTDSAAASIVTQARKASVAADSRAEARQGCRQAITGPSPNFAEEEIIMHASLDWLPSGYKNWDALLTDAVRQGHEERQGPR